VIDLYYWATPNGYKLKLFLEETGLPYRTVPINIGKGKQFASEFLAMAPSNGTHGGSEGAFPQICTLKARICH